MRRMYSEKQIEGIAKQFGVNKIQSDNFEEIDKIFAFDVDSPVEMYINFNNTLEANNYMGLLSIYSLVGDEQNIYVLWAGKIYPLVAENASIQAVGSAVDDGFSITSDDPAEFSADYEDLYKSNLCVISLVLF